MFRRLWIYLRLFIRHDPMLRQFVPTSRAALRDRQKCPHCQQKTPQRIIRSWENLARLVVNLICVLLLIASIPVFGVSFQRRCLRCGGSFVNDAWRKPRKRRCPVCGYNLRDNTSGRCPECGWHIPPGVVPELDALRDDLAE